MPTALCNGVRISYLVEGEGVPVAFIHGGAGGVGTTFGQRDPQTCALDLPTHLLPTNQFRVLAYDRRGTGQSEYIEAEYTVVELAEDLHELLRHVGMGRANVVGFSMGGMVALQYALSHSETVIGLCLVATGASLGSRIPQREGLVERLRLEGERAVFEAWKARLLNPLNVTTSAEPDLAHANDMASRLAALSDAELSHLWRGEINNRLAFRGVDYTARLTQLGMPVCILHGDRDEVVPPALGAAIAERIPRAELHLISGADHGVLLAPEAGEVLREWLVRVSRP